MSQIFEKVKGINNLQNGILSKLNELTECKDVEDKEEQKKKMDDIFEKKTIGKPQGTWEQKQQQYFEMVNSGKIKNRISKTLEYYHMCKHEIGEYIINILPSK